MLKKFAKEFWSELPRSIITIVPIAIAYPYIFRFFQKRFPETSYLSYILTVAVWVVYFYFYYKPVNNYLLRLKKKK